MIAALFAALAAVSPRLASGRTAYNLGGAEQKAVAAWPDRQQDSGLPMRLLRQTDEGSEFDDFDGQDPETACANTCGSAAIYVDDNGFCECVNSFDECKDICGDGVTTLTNGECKCDAGGLAGAIIAAIVLPILFCCCICGVIPALVWCGVITCCWQSGKHKGPPPPPIGAGPAYNANPGAGPAGYQTPEEIAAHHAAGGQSQSYNGKPGYQAPPQPNGQYEAPPPPGGQYQMPPAQGGQYQAGQYYSTQPP